ncbi:amino acid adenylation domain-containing protein [Nocardiopsis ansamitocini]|uniref:Non-ribosomal peptide synthetase n=1 Tax=Nocardiopsis ansamitocini TaxID=1670832 RepID=A0A9W6UKJ2_9ACTN|nr:non-ribosomal peptide synthetase [Nocardiopsis ansamitocini]GLU49115.1 non-ribosomal peptide synthetase [Nocardiopsis ansamitocini]
MNPVGTKHTLDVPRLADQIRPSVYQNDIWAAESRMPGSPQFNVVINERLEGVTDRDLLKACTVRALRRHDAFRMRITEDEEGIPRLWPTHQDSWTPRVETVDLSAEKNPAAAVSLWQERALNHPFEQGDGPLFQTVLLVESPTSTHLYLKAHHIVADAWALNQLSLEIISDYRDRLDGRVRTTSEPNSFFAEICRSHAYTTSVQQERDRSFHRENLDGFTPALFTRSAPGRAERGRHSFTIDGKIVRRILEAGSSPLPYLATTVGVWLTRVLRSSEVVLGVPFLNRHSTTENKIIGQFANNLPLRIQVDEKTPILDLASATKDRLRKMRAHERLPFGEILRETAAGPGGRRQLFDVTLSYMRYPRPPQISGLERTTTIMAPVHEANVLSIMVHAFEDEDDLRVDLDYACDVFDEDLTAEAFAGHINELVRKGLDLAELPVSGLSMLTDSEYEVVVRRHQGEYAHYPSEKTLDILFSEHATRTPDHPAVHDEGSGTLTTYGELDRLSNQVARTLRAEGVGSNSRVAIMAERGTELLPGLLGILKAGAAYVPIDPSYPEARIRMLLDDCGASTVLLSKGVSEDRAPGAISVHRISDLFHGSNRPLAPAADSGDLAYVIYTSGSTGRPKGVMVEHHSVVNRLTWMQRHYPIGADDTLLQKTPTSFDVSVWELFWWSSRGASVALLPPGAEKDPHQILRSVHAHGVTAIHFVPSMLGPFLDLLEDDSSARSAASSLRYVFCSGEALPAERVNQFNRIFDGAQKDGTAPLLVNLYGPTEAAVDVTRYDCPPASAGPVARVPIGRPVQNTSLYVLGAHGGPQPIGTPGELCIGGVQVARGYLDRADLTDEKFVKDPFSPGGRLYRTGDLARLLHDGTIEYLGRLDGQVKIRGNRVELGEVQNALVSLSEIRNAVVIDHTQAGRGTVLVGYYTAEAELDTADLSTRLRASLPEYMIPAVYIRIDHLPLSPSGKADRGALPSPSTALRTGRGGAPTTPTETVLAGVLAEVLGVDNVGVHDDYYGLGGDSITMLRVRALAEKAGVPFDLSDLVQNPTVKALAELVDQGLTGSDPRTVSTRAKALEPFALVSQVDRARLEGREDAFPITRLQLGLLFHSRERQDSAVYKDVFRYSIAMPWDEERFSAAFARLASRHPALRSSFALADYSEPLQVVDRTVSGGLGTADLRQVPAQKAEAAVVEYMQKWRLHDYMFDQAPLYRFQAFVMPETVEIVLSFHHALLDGGSVANLLSELLQDYLHTSGMEIGPVTGAKPPTPALHAADERAAIASVDSREYWRARLDGALPPQIEGFKAHGHDTGTELIVREIVLSEELQGAVRSLADEHVLPVKSILFTTHLMALRALSGQADLTTGLVTHGRPDIEDGERICGLFLNTLPIRSSFDRGTWLEAVRNTVEVEREAHPHRRVPLAVIQEDLGAGTLVDTAFNYIHFRQLGPIFQVPGVEDRGFEAWEETNFTLLVNAMADPVDGRIRLRMDFSGRVFTEEQGALFAEIYARLLRRIAEQPTAAADLSFLAPAGMLSAAPRACTPVDVVSAFEERVRAAPGRTALVFGEETWNYAWLDDISERIARKLLSAGANPGDRIAIAMERGSETVAVLLGVARSGCSAVPLDVSYPPERLRLMVEQSAPKHVVVHPAYADLIEDQSLVLSVASLVAGTAAPLREASGALPRVSPEDEAYLLFTSGSTGTPKGVSMPHRALANLVAWQNRVPSGAVGGRTLQYAPLSFDVSFQELYSTLCGGGTLVVVSEELRRDMPGLLRMIDRAEVERLFMPYVALQRLAEASSALGIVPRRLAVIGSSGEQLKVTDEIRQFCRSLDGVVLENQYGPTESHVVTAHSLSGDPARFPLLPPIGKPIDGARVLVLDSLGRPSPVGGKGEIYLGGVCLAAGYAGRPELTEERFVADPTRSDGERIYRTGDIGMVLPGGDIVCLGRADRQVKIRGYRVEPGEVELALAEAVAFNNIDAAEVAVVARRRESGDNFLAAYLAGGEEETVFDGIRRRLQSVLPDYMVPVHFEWVPAMPTTPSGKRDDDALRRRTVRIQNRSTDSAAPTNSHERVLVEMLGDLLDLPGIGIHDNLFELGATSITAMRLAVLIEQRFGSPIPLSELIVSPTVAELALRLPVSGEQGDSIGTAFNPLVPIRRGGSSAPMFYVHPMGGNVLCYVPFAKYLPAEQPFFALQAFGTDSGTEPIRGMEEIARCYIEAMREVQPEGPYHIGGWSFGGFVAFEMARQLREAGQRIGSLVLLDTTALGAGRNARVDDEALIAWFFWELLWLERGGASPEAVIPAGLVTLDEKFEFITQLAIDEGVLPPGSTDAIVRRLFRLYEANWRSAFDYWPEVVDQDMVLVHAKKPLPDVLMSMHSAIGSMHADPANGWRERTSGNLSVIEVEGDHLTIMEEPYVIDVATKVLGIIDDSVATGRE